MLKPAVTTYLSERGPDPGIGKTAATAVDAAGRPPLALPGEAATAMLINRIAAKLLHLDPRS